MKHKITVGDWRSTTEMERLVLQTMRAGRLTYGLLSQEFERTFAQMHEVNFAILCNSGTDALRIALRALKIQRGWADGDKIIVPAVTFVATLNIVIDEGLTPVLVDIDPDYYHISPYHLEDTILWHKQNTSAPIVGIIPVHLFGQPIHWKMIEEITEHYGLAVLEDSCECMLAKATNKYVGGLGDIAAFSTYAAHLVTTGVGGIVTTNNVELAALSRSLANHGRDGIYISIDDDKEGRQETIRRRFSFQHRGFSSRVTELQAAVGLPQLKTLQKDIGKRGTNAKILYTLLSKFKDELHLPTIREGNTHSWMMFPILLKDGDKWDLINYLEENGVETREMLPLTNQPAYKEWLNPEDYPVADKVNKQGFYIGCHQYLSDTQLYYVGSVFEHFFS